MRKKCENPENMHKTLNCVTITTLSSQFYHDAFSSQISTYLAYLTYSRVFALIQLLLGLA